MNQVFRRPNDPHIYLMVMNEWYCFNPQHEPLGSGAMGTVYIGHKCSDRTPVAIKQVKEMYANQPVIRARARQEASLAFRHQNLIEMLGICEMAPDHGPLFMVSKYVVGKNADDFIKEDISDDRRVAVVCNVIDKVLDALDYIHSRGVVHRDIKPSNIMIEENSNVRLMDLGIARATGGNAFSQYGFIGTPQYSAPEQILRPKDNNVTFDGRTDIYALGVTMYELLTGTNPFNEGTDAEVLSRQLKYSLPSHPKIPKPIMEVISKATEKKQDDRFASAAEFKAALAEALKPKVSWWQKFINWFFD